MIHPVVKAELKTQKCKKHKKGNSSAKTLRTQNSFILIIYTYGSLKCDSFSEINLVVKEASKTQASGRNKIQKGRNSAKTRRRQKYLGSSTLNGHSTVKVLARSTQI